MRNYGLIQPFVAGGTIEKHRLVKFDATDGQVVAAAAATDTSIGVTTFVGSESGETVDVVLSDAATVKLGGTVTQGDKITAGAAGVGVAAAAGQPYVGIALASGVSGDEISVLIQPGNLPV